MSNVLNAAQIQAKFDDSPFIAWLGLSVSAVDHERGELLSLIHISEPTRPY